MHESCSSIRPLASKIFIHTAVSFPTDMRPPRYHSATTSRGNYSRCGALIRFFAMEVSRFVLYFLFFCLNNSATILNFLLECGRYMLSAYSWPGFRPGYSVRNGLHYMVRRPPFSTASLSNVYCTVNFARKTSRGGIVAVIATASLTKDKDWKEFRRGQLLMLDRGLPYSEFYDFVEVEREGRILCSISFPKSV